MRVAIERKLESLLFKISLEIKTGVETKGRLFTVLETVKRDDPRFRQVVFDKLTEQFLLTDEEAVEIAERLGLDVPAS